MNRMTTDDAFNDWIKTQPSIKWANPLEVRKAFIEFGDYVKDRYYNYKSNK